jgi:hypothetical protein
MNQALLEARKKFMGQKAKLDGHSGYDNSPFPEGKYTCKIVKADIQNREVKDSNGLETPRLVFCLEVVNGTHKGRKQWPFPPDLAELEGLTRAASTLRIILGDEGAVTVPGVKKGSGDFELDVDKFLMAVETLASECIGKMVETSVKNSKKARQDGSLFQNIYINRALGLDQAGVSEDDDDVNQLPFDKGTSTAKKTAKKPVKAVKKAKR